MTRARSDRRLGRVTCRQRWSREVSAASSSTGPLLGVSSGLGCGSNAVRAALARSAWNYHCWVKHVKIRPAAWDFLC